MTRRTIYDVAEEALSEPYYVKRILEELGYSVAEDGTFEFYRPTLADLSARINATSRHIEHVANEIGWSVGSNGKFRFRRAPQRGEDNPGAKLNETKVREIRALLESGSSLASLSRRYGVGVKTIANIRDRLSWRHLA